MAGNKFVVHRGIKLTGLKKHVMGAFAITFNGYSVMLGELGSWNADARRRQKNWF